MSDYSDLILTSSPVGYWRLNETTGVTASDISGEAHHGTYTNTYTLNQQGLVDQDATSKSVIFDGTDGLVTMVAGVPEALHGAAAVTLEVWVLMNTIAAPTQAINVSTGTNLGSAITLESTTSVKFSGRSVAADALQSDVATVGLLVGKKTHIVTVCDYANDKLYGYVNGVQVTDKAVTFNNVTFTYAADTLIGAIGATASGTSTMDGRICDVVSYPSALSPAVVLSHYEAGAAQPENQRRAKSAIKGYYSIHHLGI